MIGWLAESVLVTGIHAFVKRMPSTKRTYAAGREKPLRRADDRFVGQNAKSDKQQLVRTQCAVLRSLLSWLAARRVEAVAIAVLAFELEKTLNGIERPFRKFPRAECTPDSLCPST